ncbi:sortase [Candidatus Gottesmanbacteria bacterium]|nr:sortase [Candidatus Gottesmanbacteria bacterium]
MPGERINKAKSLSFAAILTYLGMACIAAAVVLVGLTFYPVFKVELSYWLYPPKTNIAVSLAQGANASAMVPKFPELGIVIPKIGANAKIITNVDPYDSRVYQEALTKGVAHAKGSVLPGSDGNSFLFSHSSANFYEATRYNSVFYLLTKLDIGDKIYVFVNNQKFTYTVTSKKIVDPKDVDFLSPKATGKQLTLMTCWPAGTSFKRYIILAQVQPDK